MTPALHVQSLHMSICNYLLYIQVVFDCCRQSLTDLTVFAPPELGTSTDWRQIENFKFLLAHTFCDLHRPDSLCHVLCCSHASRHEHHCRKWRPSWATSRRRHAATRLASLVRCRRQCVRVGGKFFPRRRRRRVPRRVDAQPPPHIITSNDLELVVKLLVVVLVVLGCRHQTQPRLPQPSRQCFYV